MATIYRAAECPFHFLWPVGQKGPRHSPHGRTNTICRHSGANGASVAGRLAHFPGVRYGADAAVLLADGVDHVEEPHCLFTLVTHGDQSLQHILEGPDEEEEEEEESEQR